MAQILGIDVGGSAIKGSLVDTIKGELLSERMKVETPDPSKPAAVAEVVKQFTTQFGCSGTVGIGFPAVVKNGVCQTAANVHKSWIGTNIEVLLGETTGCKFKAVNDADAAGIAEMRFGAGKGIERGVIIVLTLGTGIGSAIFVDGRLLPNSEFGHLEMGGKDAEKQASANVRDAKSLTWKEWGKRLNTYLKMVENLIYPDLIILGGGVSSRYEKYQPFLNIRTRIVPAELLNNAGIIGAALAAESLA